MTIRCLSKLSLYCCDQAGGLVKGDKGGKREVVNTAKGTHNGKNQQEDPRREMADCIGLNNFSVNMNG